MPEAIFTIGLAASGKTTWAHQQKGYIVLDSDQLRLELWGSETKCTSVAANSFLMVTLLSSVAPICL